MKQRIARLIDTWAEKVMDGGSRALCGPSEFEATATAHRSGTNTYLSGPNYSSTHTHRHTLRTGVLSPNVTRVGEVRDSSR